MGKPAAEPAPAPAADTVPLATFLEIKKDNKELAKAVKDLETLVRQGAAPVEVSDEIAALGKEFDVDSQFLSKLTTVLTNRARGEAKAEAEATLKPLQEKERQAAIDQAFKTHFDAALEAAPEFKGIANADVIKTLSLDPKNANKTFAQIIEDTYGALIPGKRTIETTQPGGGKEPETIDFDRAGKDGEYFKQIMANPTLKAKYNAELPKRLKL